jgi:hypothetical protein
MVGNRVVFSFSVKVIALIVAASFCQLASAQETTAQPTLIAYKTALVEPAPSSTSFLPAAPSTHKFWDRENRFLFLTAAAFSAADFTVTRSNLANGGRELNPLVRPFTANNATLAANFVGQTAAIISISYLLHRTGHHRLERLTPAANIAASAFAVAYGMSHR